MALVVQHTADAALNIVQENVKKELDELAAAIPSKTTPVVAVAADYTVNLADAIVFANPVVACSITLPPMGSCAGLRFTVKNTSAAGLVHVRGRYSAVVPELIDGAVRRDLAAGVVATFYSDGAAWWAVG
jgi:hypothetical protein